MNVVVIGGGAAGLSAALVLGRARRRVAVIDAGTGKVVFDKLYTFRGDNDAALVGFLTAVGGANPEARLNKTMASGWYDQALADLPTLFGGDLPSLGSWSFGEAAAARITHPALTVLGTDTFPLCAESHELLNAWLPHAEPFVLHGATHLLQLDDPDAMAAGLLAFL